MSTNLPDIQGQTDNRQIPLQRAGVCDVALPIVLHNDQDYSMVASIDATVLLPAESKGVHMSRFIEQLAVIDQWSLNLESVLRDMRDRHSSPEAELSVSGQIFVDRAAPVTGKTAPMGYQIAVSGALSDAGYQGTVTINVLAASCCPCSKDIADYGAHNQRVHITATLAYDQSLQLQDLITALETAGSAQVYPILKRPDEKTVTETQYDQSKFVEDIVRDAVLNLQQLGVSVVVVRAETLESIHPHNAFAEYYST